MHLAEDDILERDFRLAREDHATQLICSSTRALERSSRQFWPLFWQELRINPDPWEKSTDGASNILKQDVKHSLQPQAFCWPLDCHRYASMQTAV